MDLSELDGLSFRDVRRSYRLGVPPTTIIDGIKARYPEANHASYAFLFMEVFGISFKDAMVASRWCADNHCGLAERDVNERLSAAIETQRSLWGKDDK